MAKIDTIEISLEALLSPALESLASLLEVLGASERATECFVDHFAGVIERGDFGLFVCCDDAADVLIREAVQLATGRAGELISLKFDPTDRYLEAVAAVVACAADTHSIISHGWPILSLVGDTASMTEAAGASSSSRGGAA